MESFLVSNNLYSHHIARGVIPASQDLTERSLAQSIDDLVSELNMVTRDDLVVSTFIVVAMIISSIQLRSHFLSVPSSNIVDFFIIHYFIVLVLAHLVAIKLQCT